MSELSSIRIFPLTMFYFETEEIAKLKIANGLESGNHFSNLNFNSHSLMNAYGKNLFLFQYKGKIIGKATVHIDWDGRGSFYYLMIQLQNLISRKSGKTLKNLILLHKTYQRNTWML